MKHDELNERLRTFLISSRENAGLSQSDVAARSEVFGIGRTLDQRAVSRIESQPMNADAIKIAGYLSAVGIQPSKYYEILTEYTYKEDDYIMSEVGEQTIKIKVEAAKSLISSVKDSIDCYNHEYIDSIGLKSKVEQLEAVVDGLNRKPVIGCFGHFDAGKSTLINTVINQSLLPTKYQPATCVVNLLMHESDKPETISGNVAVFKKGFKPHMVHSPVDVEKYLIEQGGSEILDRLGVHNHEDDVLNEAYIAIVFSDSEILRSVWLLDTPGDLNGSDESDTEKALGGVELTDGVVFVSNHTGFFKDSDLGFASNIIRQRPPVDKEKPLDHLMFIQSHCHSEISRDDVEAVGRVTFKRIKKQLDNLIFSSWMEDGFITQLPESSELTARVQPFWRENNDYRSDTLRKITEMASSLTLNQASIVDKYISNILKNIENMLLSEIDNLKNKKSETFERIKEVNEKDARFRELSTQLIKDFNSLIESCNSHKKHDLDVMSTYYKYNTSVEGLEDLINDTYSDKKEAQSELGNYISQLLTTKLESTLKTSGKAVSTELDSLLLRWQEAAPTISTTGVDTQISGLGAEFSAFNSRAAFVGGLAGLGSLGAMALYVSTIASNLGAYILVGKAAGLLVSLGLVGSVTTVTSFVAAIGGPITIGIALAAAIGYIIYRLAGGSWQKSLAKKAAEAIRKESVFDDIEKAVTEYWNSTSKAIKAGLDELIIKTDEHIENLKADAKVEYDIDEVDVCVSLIDDTLLILKSSD